MFKGMRPTRECRDPFETGKRTSVIHLKIGIERHRTKIPVSQAPGWRRWVVSKHPFIRQPSNSRHGEEQGTLFTGIQSFDPGGRSSREVTSDAGALPMR